MRARENYQKCDNPLKSNGNLVYRDDDSNNKIIIAMLFDFLFISDMEKWVIDCDATRHFCCNKELYSSFKKGDDKIYLVDSGTTKVLGKVVIKLTTGKSLQLNDVLYISIV